MNQRPPPDETPPERTATLRILDAAANRAMEGLRTAEDYVRFVLDDAHLSRLTKVLRHRLLPTLSRLDSFERIAARDTLADVGTAIHTECESQRADLWSVAQAGLKRAQEALRSLEEYGKPIDGVAAAEFGRLRYECYSLERAIDLTRDSLARLANARLYVLVDAAESLDEFSRLVEQLVSAGVHAIQLREQRLADRELLGRGRRLTELTRSTSTLAIINDRADIAVLSRADGVHVGQEDMAAKDARSIVGPRRLIGVSTHSIEQARQAVLDGANYIGVGPTFPSTTKDFSEFPGLPLLTQVAAEIKLPAFALGGIGPENLRQVLDAGLRRVAVSAAITQAANPEQAARQMLDLLM